MEKLSDVLTLNAANLAYLRWDGIPMGTDLYTAMFNIRSKDANKLDIRHPRKSRHVCLAYSEEEQNESPLWGKILEDWEFVYAADRQSLVRDLFGWKHVCENNGFYAVCFRNKHQYLFAFRGTDDLEDYFTDLHLGFFDHWNDQLSCVYWFVKYVIDKKIPSNVLPELHFTGHSLGGALAQFATMIFQEEMYPVQGVTWNALGMGTHIAKKSADDIVVSGLAMLTQILPSTRIHDVIREVVRACKSPFTMQTESHVWEEVVRVLQKCYRQTNYHNVSSKAIYQKESSLFDGFKVQITVQDGKTASERFQNRCDVGTPSQEDFNKRMRAMDQKIQYVARELSAIWCLSKRVRKNVEQYGINQPNCINYYFPDDWTANVQTRIGQVIDVTRKTHPEADHILDFDVEDDSMIRVFRQTIKRFGFEKHGCANFLLYLNDEGNIMPGRIRLHFLSNVVQAYVQSVLGKDRVLDKIFRLQAEEHHYSIREEDLPVWKQWLRDLLSKESGFSTYCKKAHPLFYKNILHAMDRSVLQEFFADENTIVLGAFCNVMIDRINGRTGNITIHIQK